MATRTADRSPTTRHGLVPGTTNPTRPTTQLASPAYQAFLLLRITFVAAPIAFGLDKFFAVLTHWERYLAPQINSIMPGSAHQAMLVVGAVEIAAGVLVALRPDVGGYVVTGWLTGITVNLLLIGDFYDVALRDVGLLLAALALARLAAAFRSSTRAPSPADSPAAA